VKLVIYERKIHLEKLTLSLARNNASNYH